MGVAQGPARARPQGWGRTCGPRAASRPAKPSPLGAAGPAHALTHALPNPRTRARPQEWRRDRDRHLHLHSPFVAPASGMTSGEVLNLAAVLSKQSLPIHYRVTAQGGKAL